MSKIFGSTASAAFKRAADRARQVLKPGDRITLGSSCGGDGVQTVTFSHWGWLEQPIQDFSYFSAKTIDELSPWNITKVNGRSISFRDDAGQTSVELDHKRFAAEDVQSRRQSFRIVAPARTALTGEGEGG